jgi:hypothetical protein
MVGPDCTRPIGESPPARPKLTLVTLGFLSFRVKSPLRNGISLRRRMGYLCDGLKYRKSGGGWFLRTGMSSPSPLMK